MSPGLLQCLIRHLKERISTVGTVTALQVKTALMEFLKFPARTFNVLLSRGSSILQSDHVSRRAIQVPTFYAFSTPKRVDMVVQRLTSIVAILFGGIHCAGWNFPFPSHAELIIWRISSLIILTIPCIGVLSDVIYNAQVLCHEDAMNGANVETMGKILFWVFFFSTPIYGLARLTLFGEAFIALRHLPPGAYAVVEWTALLLHI